MHGANRKAKMSSAFEICLRFHSYAILMMDLVQNHLENGDNKLGILSLLSWFTTEID